MRPLITAMTDTPMAGSVAGIMVGGATALSMGTHDPASMAASPGMAAKVSMAAGAMVVAAGMLGAGMVVVAGMPGAAGMVVAEVTVERGQRRRRVP